MLYSNLEKERIIESLDYIFGFLFVTDGDGKILYLNKPAAENMGCTVEELLNTNVRDMVSGGIVSDSVVLLTLRERKQCAKLLNYKRTGHNVYVICNPIFNRKGEITMTVTLSQRDVEVDEYSKKIEKERILKRDIVSYLKSSRLRKTPIVAESRAMKQLLDLAGRIAMTDSSVMITGESGSGKEVVAQYIHENSMRAEEAFIPVNCSAIPPNLMESEFFGYEKGAFTGANPKGHAGVFEMANGGTLFLDEIGELPLLLQPKLLRVLESGVLNRVGSTREIKVDVRIIVATNRDLLGMVKQNEFRQDLYYRLNVIPIHIQPLRKRQEDITAISNMFLEQYSRKYRKRQSFSKELQEWFLKYEWPGNVRELRNMVERLVITSADGEIHAESVSITTAPEIKEPVDISSVTASAFIPDNATLKEQCRYYEYQCILRTLDSCDGNITEAASKLGISRSGLFAKLKQGRENYV